VPGRQLDDNAHVLMRFEGGARGMLWSSQVAPGNENSLRLRIYGEKGGIEWDQQDPNYLWFTPYGAPKQKLTRGGAGGPTEGTRIPPGHPEGYLEGFANIYAEAADAIEGKTALYPTVHDGLDGVKFIEACVKSSSRNAAWVKP